MVVSTMAAARASRAKRGWSMLCKLAGLITTRARPSQELAQEVGVSVKNVQRTLALWLRLGVVGRCGWRERDGRRGPVALWKLGAEDLPSPEPRPVGRCLPRGAAVTVGSVLQAMATGPHTIVELAQDVGITANSARLIVRHLHAQRVIHILDYERSRGGPWAVVYALGRRIDAPRPKPRTAAERWRAGKAEREARALAARVAMLGRVPTCPARREAA